MVLLCCKCSEMSSSECSRIYKYVSIILNTFDFFFFPTHLFLCFSLQQQMSLASSSWVRKMLSVITIHLTKHLHCFFFIAIYHFSYHLFHKVFPFSHSSVTNQRVLRVCTCVVLPPDFVKHHSAYRVITMWMAGTLLSSRGVSEPTVLSPPSENVDSSIVEDCQLQTTYNTELMCVKVHA